VGNIVGSNIANVLLILGISALLAPIAVQSAALKRDGGVLLASRRLRAAHPRMAARPLGWNGVPADACCLHHLCLLAGTRGGRDHGAAFDKAEAAQGADPALRPQATAADRLLVPLLIALAGLALVVFGGRLLVNGAVALASTYGLSETVIGLTIVAVGTSMPELVTSVMAAVRRQADVAFGNVVGSNIYNLLGIGGVTGLLAPLDVPAEIIRFDSPFMVGVTVLMVVFAWTGWRIGRREGGVLLAGYGAYLFMLWPG
jgi:cation:H+ antiporter